MANSRKKGQQGAKKKEMEFISVKSPRSSNVGGMPTEPRTSIAIGLFALVTFVFFFSHLTGSAFLWEDFGEQFLPFQVFAARSFADGTIPFWNPYTFSGMPFFADLQNGFFYPGHIVMYLLSGGELTVWLAQFMVILHYFVAMIGAWKLAGVLGVSGWGRVFSGISYGLTGMLVAHMIHPNLLYHLAFFPLIAALFVTGLRRGTIVHFLYAALTFGLVMLSGHPQSALYIALFLGLFGLFELFGRGAEVKSVDTRSSRGIVGGTALISLILAVGIFAVQYLPSQELADLSRRAEMSYEASTDGALELKQIVSLVTPKIFGVVSADTPQDLPFWLRGGGDSYYYWETAIYVGVVTLLLAIVGVATRRLGRTTWFLVGAGVLGLAYSLGDNFFVHPILGRLPFFETFRIPTRMSVYLALGASVLAGAGLDSILRGEEKTARARKATLWGGGGMLLIALLGASGTLPGMLGAPEQIASSVASTAIAPLLLILFAVAVVWAGLKRTFPPIGIAMALILLSAVDLFIYGADQNTSPTDPTIALETADHQFEFAKADPPESIFRVQPRAYGDFPGMVMLRNQGPYSKILSTEGYNPLLLERINPPAPTLEETLDLLRVKYRIVIDSATRSPAGLRETPLPYDHAWMVGAYQVVEDPDDMKRRMESGSVDLHSTVLLEREPDVKPKDGNGSADVVEWEPSRIVIETSSANPSILVLSEIYYPAWKAYVDDEPAQLLRADWSLRAVPVEAGDHRVDLRFESDAFGTGRVVSLLSLIVVLGGIGFFLFRRRTEPATPESTEESGDQEEG